MDVPAVQFLRPSGRENPGTFSDVDDSLAPEAEALAKSDLRLELEELRTGQVSLTITHEKEGDLAIRVVPNGPEVVSAVEELLRLVPQLIVKCLRAAS